MSAAPPPPKSSCTISRATAPRNGCRCRSEHPRRQTSKRQRNDTSQIPKRTPVRLVGLEPSLALVRWRLSFLWGLDVWRLGRVSRPWVRLRIDLLQPRDAHMGVDLGGREARVAEEFLHESEIRAGV